MVVEGAKSLNGILDVPPDKSIFHRALIFGSLSENSTVINSICYGKDVSSTINCLRELGIDVIEGNSAITVKGKGLRGLKAPINTLSAHNSATTCRLLCGLLAGQNFTSVITGDKSLSSRPMGRVVKPLELMGANIMLSENYTLPITVKGKDLNGIKYKMEVSSAQVKTAIILASLYCNNETVIIEEEVTRNHTELMLKSFGGDINTLTVTDKSNKNAGDIKVVTVKPIDKLHWRNINIPGDISAAAFFIVAALIIPNSEITIKGVGLNPTRTGIIDVLLEMGGDIKIDNLEGDGEIFGDITVKSSQLKGISIGGKIIPRLIDEVPILAVAAAFAKGETIIDRVGELRVKETNRLENLVTEMKKTGMEISALENGIKIKGDTICKEDNICFSSYGDHRMAMALSVLAFALGGKNHICGADSVKISYPGFYNDFERIGFNDNNLF